MRAHDCLFPSGYFLPPRQLLTTISVPLPPPLLPYPPLLELSLHPPHLLPLLKEPDFFFADAHQILETLLKLKSTNYLMFSIGFDLLILPSCATPLKLKTSFGLNVTAGWLAGSLALLKIKITLLRAIPINGFSCQV